MDEKKTINVASKTLGIEMSTMMVPDDPKLVSRLHKFYKFDICGTRNWFYIEKISCTFPMSVEYECPLIIEERYDVSSKETLSISIGSKTMSQTYEGFFKNEEISRDEFLKKYDEATEIINKNFGKYGDNYE